ncbi:MAG: orotate phosphoribosyltransferase [Planctomycetes bacterium]|nr:orotate phosphoribosyltransferase [Planctomycetota bacterium]
MTKGQLAAKIKAVAYLEGEFTLRSGAKSKYYLDKYLFETDPEILAELGRRFAERMGKAELIAGAELGAVPLAAAASLASGRPYVIVRNSKKGYGTGKQIEGRLPAGAKVLLVEDVVTTGGQLIEAAKALTAAGAVVEKIICTIDRLQGGRENITDAGFDFESLLTREDLGITA